MSNKLIEIAEDSARGGFFLFTGNASQLIILAIGSIIIGRLLGPENYGLLSISLVVPITLTGLIDLGVNSAMIRFSAKFVDEGHPHAYLHTNQALSKLVVRCIHRLTRNHLCLAN